MVYATSLKSRLRRCLLERADGDASACNYNADATDDDGSCDFADAGYDCDGVCLNDADGDGVCDEFEVDVPTQLPVTTMRCMRRV